MPTKKALTLSLIIPVYNEEAALLACLQSVARQTDTPDQVIVVDNNSTDQTRRIAKQFPFVTLIREPRQGVLFARTAGFNAATTDILGRIDADTRLEPTWVARAKADFADKRVMAITGSSHCYDMPLSPWNHWVEDFVKDLLYKHEKGFPFLFGTNMAIRSSAWKSIRSQLCNEEYIFEDADIAIHLFQNKQKIVYDIGLRAGMSARRYSDKPRAFMRYNRLQSITYKKHGIHTLGSSFAMVTYYVGYILLRPLALSYDAKTGAYSLRKLLKRPNQARPHPFK